MLTNQRLEIVIYQICLMKLKQYFHLMFQDSWRRMLLRFFLKIQTLSILKSIGDLAHTVRKYRGFINAKPPNNSFNPSANSAAFIRQLEWLVSCLRARL